MQYALPVVVCRLFTLPPTSHLWEGSIPLRSTRTRGLPLDTISGQTGSTRYSPSRTRRSMRSYLRADRTPGRPDPLRWSLHHRTNALLAVAAATGKAERFREL